jgi:hypothetical protein
MENSNDYARLSAETFDSFLAQFGPPDIYTTILLEELFAVLLNYKGVTNAQPVDIPQQEGQE